MHSMVGESVVPSTPQKPEGHTILCLDGGGLKVKDLAPCSACCIIILLNACILCSLIAYCDTSRPSVQPKEKLIRINFYRV